MRRSALVLGIAACTLLGAGEARAQGTNVFPLLDSATVSGTTLTCWFGYVNGNESNHVVPIGGANFFIPGPINRGQPTTLLPGVHRKVMSSSVDLTQVSQLSWTFGISNVTCTSADAVHIGPAPVVDPSAAMLAVRDADGTHRLLVTPGATEISAPGGVAIYTNAARTTGVYVGAGSGSWSTLSDVNRKTDFAEVDADDVLARVARLPVYTWSYIGEAEGVRHIGPTAQDFRAAFGLGDSDRSIATVDIDGVNLVALKALESRVRALEDRQRYILERLEGQHPAPLTPAAEDTLLQVTKGTDTYLTVTSTRTTAVAPGGFLIRTGPATDVHLAPGSGTWAITSDSRAKRDVTPADMDRVLTGIRALDISAWRYIGEPPSTRHVGPSAQDFFAAFGLGDSDRAIAMVDADGVTLAGIRALTQRLEQLERSVDPSRR